MSDDPIAFGSARLDEDEAAARAAADTAAVDWHATGAVTATGPVILVASGEYDDVEVATVDLGGDDIAAHIARHDPARVLREVEAGRRTLQRHRTCGSGHGYCDGVIDGDRTRRTWPLCDDLADLLYRWADHSDYNPAWKP